MLEKEQLLKEETVADMNVSGENNCINIPVYTGLVTCRYCLEEDRLENLLAPCVCTGSSRYVHRECLITWLKHKNSRPVIPGYFSQFDLSCEICKTLYKTSQDTSSVKPKFPRLSMAIYFSVLTAILFSSYFLVGWLLDQSEGGKELFTSRGDHTVNILLNGFILVQLIIGVFYLLVLLVMTSRQGGCYCCFFPSGSSSCSGDCSEGVLVAVIVFGFICLMFTVYVDITTRLLTREKNRAVLSIENLTFSCQRTDDLRMRTL